MRRGFLLPLVFLVACSASSNDTSKPAPSITAAKPAPAPANTPPPKQIAQPKPPSREDQARQLLDEWAAAQNAGDFDRYAALYAERFLGVKRVESREQQFPSREAWLADRKRMFKRPIHVEVAAPRIRMNDKGAAVRFVQHFTNGKFQDVGPKQLVLLPQAGGALRITKEEMLKSTVIGERTSRDPKQFAFVTELRGRIAIELEPPAQPYPLESFRREGAIEGKEDGSNLSISAQIAKSAESPQLAAWRGARVRIFGAEGEECSAKVEELLIAVRYSDRVFSNWADDWWDDDGNQRKLEEPEMLERLRGPDAFLAAMLDVETTGGCAKTATFARAADLPASIALAKGDGTPALEQAVRDALRQAPSYADDAKYAKDDHEVDDLASEVGIVFFGLPGKPPLFAWAVARMSCPCWSCDVEVDVLFKIDSTGDTPTISVWSEPSWGSGVYPLTFVDVNANGDFHPVVADDLSATYFDHPTLGVSTRDVTIPPDDELRAP